VILGASESGKSWFAKRLVDRLSAAKPVLVWDPQAEWAGPDADAGIRGARCFAGVAELCASLRAGPPAPGARLVVQSARRGDFAALCRLAYTAGNLAFVVDEAHQVLKADRCPREAEELMQVSRHRRVDLVLIAQRPTGIGPDFRDNKAECILFRMPGEASLQWVRAEFGKSVEERLRAMPARAWIRLT
jgi:DNA helicase HerA-like ATPase